MEITRVLAVAPYDGLGAVISGAAGAHPSLSVRVCTGNLEAGAAEAARRLAEEGADIILSRGGTARMLRDALPVPVIDIPITVGDILQAIKLAENSYEKYSVVGFPNITNNAKFIRDLMQYDLDVFTVDSADEVPGLLKELGERKYGLVLCDMIASTLAGQAGMRALLITSSAESVEAALSACENLGRTLDRQKGEAAALTALLRKNPTHSFLLGADGKITLSSLDDTKENRRLRSFAEKYAKDAWKHDEVTVDQHIGDRIISAAYKRGGGKLFCYMNVRGAPVHGEGGGIRIISKGGAEGGGLEAYRGASAAAAKVRSLADAYGKSPQPVYISGENGTGKDAVAAHLYENGIFSHSPLYQIDCAEITDKRWYWLTQTVNTPLSGTGYTVYFKNAGALTPARWDTLSQMMETGLHKRDRLIFSGEPAPPEDARRGGTGAHMAGSPAYLNIPLPPLRERAEDIPGLAALYISRLNAELGRSVAGLEPDALEELRGYSWPQNLVQLGRVLRECVALTEGFYVTRAQVGECLKKERHTVSGAASRAGGNINLEQTLDNIVFDVVSAVLDEEGGNQKKAADRLGVSRTTVWRVLRDKRGQGGLR